MRSDEVTGLVLKEDLGKSSFKTRPVPNCGMQNEELLQVNNKPLHLHHVHDRYVLYSGMRLVSM